MQKTLAAAGNGRSDRLFVACERILRVFLSIWISRWWGMVPLPTNHTMDIPMHHPLDGVGNLAHRLPAHIGWQYNCHPEVHENNTSAGRILPFLGDLTPGSKRKL